MARKIVITSGKGGVGKTTFCANIGIALAKQNAKVCLIDLDIGLNNLDVALGIENKIIYDIIDVASGKCRISQALLQDSNFCNLFVLPSSQSYARHTLTLEKLKQIVSCIDNSFDFIIIDCPAGIDDGFYKASALANEAIVLVNPHIFSIRDADKVVRILLNMPLTKINIVVNKVKNSLVGNGEMLSPTTISHLLKCPLIGVIEENIEFCLNTILEEEKNKNCFNLIAKNILSGNCFEEKPHKKSLFSLFKRGLKKVE